VITYAQYNVVEYSGTVYRSKISSNTNLEPDTNPNSWETLFVGIQDGDIAVVVNGSSSAITQRTSGAFVSTGSTPISVTLADNQPSPTVAVTFLGSSFAFAKFEYTLTRGAGQGQKRKGTYNVLNDTTITDVEYDHMFNDIGNDVGVSMTWSYSGASVQLLYTSTNQGLALALKYTLGGWT
jgi:hypothetical protein